MNKLTRRELLQIVGIGAVSTVISVDSSHSESKIEKKSVPSCILTPEQTEGPFYFDVEQVREDITEGKKGTSLKMVVTVVESKECKPIKDAVVDIWHADASGIYSGYKNQGVDTTGQTYLRGIQVTDSEGKAGFTTIYPGLYPGRVPHVHFKVILDNKNYVTSQLYFPTEISKQVYKNDPSYNKSGSIDESSDRVVRWYGGADKLRMTVKKDKNTYIATHIIGIQT
ncbi:MAG: intradiol ring-cleavage dioxygenase [Thermodesulfobacteriota bacterium]